VLETLTMAILLQIIDRHRDPWYPAVRDFRWPIRSLQRSVRRSCNDLCHSRFT